MRIILILLLVLPSVAFAHAGHVIEAAGHNHWIALGAIGAAALAALWSKHKEKQQAEADSDEAEDAGDLEEEPA